jgi:hypothetical protein
MTWKRFLACTAVAASALVAVACGPLPQSPVGSLTSPYHGDLGGGSQVAGYPPANSQTFSGCASTPGTISVALGDGSGVVTPPGPYSSTYTVAITEPRGGETQSGMFEGQTLTSPHTVGIGDCFSVTLTASIVLATSTGCDDPFEPDCAPGAIIPTWGGTLYTITW